MDERGCMPENFSQRKNDNRSNNSTSICRYVITLTYQLIVSIKKVSQQQHCKNKSLREQWLSLLERAVKAVLGYDYTMRFIGCDSIQTCSFFQSRAMIYREFERIGQTNHTV